MKNFKEPVVAWKHDLNKSFQPSWLKEKDMVKKYLSTQEVRDLLAPLDDAAVTNWLHGGYFPGSFKDEKGEWWFDKTKALSVKDYCDKIRVSNKAGSLEWSYDEETDPGDPPLLF